MAVDLDLDDNTTPAARPTADLSEVAERLIGLLRDDVDIHRCTAAQALARIGADEAVPALIETLRDEDPDVRTDAAGALRAIADPIAAAPLLENLVGDPCTDVKMAAIDALVALRHEPAVAWLRRLAVSRDEDVAWDDDDFFADEWDDWVDIQVKAINGLAELGIEAAVPDITTAIDHEFGQDLLEVGFKALARLGHAGPAYLIEQLRSKDPKRRHWAYRGLLTQPGPLAPELVAHGLGEADFDNRMLMVDAVIDRDRDDDCLPTLLDDPDPRMRAAMVSRIGTRHPNRIAARMQDPSLSVRLAVLSLVSEHPDVLPAETVRAWAPGAFESKSEKAAIAAVRALAAVAPEENRDRFQGLALEPRNTVDLRRAALSALHETAGADAIDALCSLAGDAVREIRFDALVALQSFAGYDESGANPAATALLEALTGTLVPPDADEDEERAEPAAFGTENAALDPADDADGRDSDDVADTIRDGDAGTRDERGENEAMGDAPTSTLEAILGAGSPELEVVRGGGGDVELTGKDLEFLGLARQRARGKKKLDWQPRIPAHHDTRRFAARLLGDLPDIRVAHALISVLDDGDAEVKANALDSLVRLGELGVVLDGSVVDVLRDVLNQTVPALRLAALRAVAFGGNGPAETILRQALRDKDSFLRVASIQGLARRGVSAAEIANLVLADDDASVRLAAAEALVALGDTRALDLLCRLVFMNEGHHRKAGALLLRRLDRPSVNGAMLAVLDDPEQYRQFRIAAEVLAEVNAAEAEARV